MPEAQIEPVPSSTGSDAELGRARARSLYEHWPEDPGPPHVASTEYARAALEEFAHLRMSEAGVIKAALGGADDTASDLNVDSFQAVVEVLQNAEDARAAVLLLALVGGPDHYQLCFAHNGSPIVLKDALAMYFAYVSTKREDALAKGRFGIGLKTLAALGTNLRVDCHPYHFTISGSQMFCVDSPPPAFEAYRDDGTWTLVTIDLLPDFDFQGLLTWLVSFDSSGLMFLDSVRRLALTTAIGVQPILDRAIQVDVRRLSRQDELKLTVADIADGTGQRWTRFSTVTEVPHGLSRRRKATSRETQISIAIPHRGRRGLAQKCRFFAGLPLRPAGSLPFDIDAEFDPDTARHVIKSTAWNEWLLGQLPSLLSAAAIELLRIRPRLSWYAIPRSGESRSAAEGLPTAPASRAHDAKAVADLVAELSARVQDQFRELARFAYGDGQLLTSQVAFEASGLDGLVSIEDQDALSAAATPLPTRYRDSDGRWRLLLDEMGVSQIITAADALALCDAVDAQGRPTSWFIGLANAVLAERKDAQLLASRCVRLADGRNVTPGSLVLLKRGAGDPIAFELDLAAELDPRYFAVDAKTERVRHWLRHNNALREDFGLAEALERMPNRYAQKPLHLDDRLLLMFRDKLDTLDDSVRERLGAGIGKCITVEGYEWREGRRTSLRVLPSEAYQPSTIDKTPRGWAVAAKTTPGLKWVAGRYGDLLAESGTEGSRAARLFTVLGAERAPRLTDPPGPRMDDHYANYAPAELVSTQSMPRAQLEDVQRLPRSLTVTHLVGDKWSPDLDRVLDSIVNQEIGEARSARTRALFETLDRSWQRFVRYIECQAVYPRFGWVPVGTVRTTWLARLTSARWLSTEDGRPAAPSEVVIRTWATELANPSDRFAEELASEDQRSPLIIHMGVRRDPTTGDILQRLRDLRTALVSSRPFDPASPDRLYTILAQRCPAAPAKLSALVGEITVEELRSAFGIAAQAKGLVYADGRWLPPAKVFIGLRIFGNRRAFVSADPRLLPLWQTLAVDYPDVADCARFLEEVAADPLTDEERGPLILTYRYLAERLGSAPAASVAALRTLPVWSGSEWLRNRPIHAVTNPTMEEDLRHRIALWVPPCALSTLGQLPTVMGLTIIRSWELPAAGVDAMAAAMGLSVGDRFRSAIRQLRTELLLWDEQLFRAATIDWTALEAADVVIAEHLAIRFELVGLDPFDLPVVAHATRSPLCFYFASTSAMASREAGWVMASFFEGGDQHKLAMMWQAAWVNSESGIEAVGIDIPEEPKPIPGAIEENDVGIGKPKSKRFKSTTDVSRDRNEEDKVLHKETSPKAEEQAPAPRQLKAFTNLRSTQIFIAGKPSGGGSVETTKRRGTKPAPTSPRDTPDRRRAAPRGYQQPDVEDLAFRLLRTVFEERGRELSDLRDLRGVGADSIDDLRRYVEIKANVGELPDSVSLVANEAEVAAREKHNYYLAVFSGLEDGETTRLKIFQNPLRALDWRPNTQVTLTGIKTKLPLIEVAFEDA